MIRTRYRFPGLDGAIAALDAVPEPLVLSRFEPVPTDNVIIAANAAAARSPIMPTPGQHPDRERDRDISVDIELDYLYRQLVERGHARQVLSLSGRLYELTVNRVDIDGDDKVYAFVTRRPLDSAERR